MSVVTQPSTARFGSPLLIAIALGLLFAALSLRGVSGHAPIDPDAARHAMNGVLIHDWLRSGQLLNPMPFARAFYERYPAISLPYHPPVFPAMEAAFYSVFGVNHASARYAIATTVFVSAVLLFLLVFETHQSRLLAFVATVSFCSLRISQNVATDVMLEFPSMALIVAALYLLRRLPDGYSFGRALGFAAIASTAIWTKQQALFLGAVPFVYAAVFRRWNLFRSPAIWVSSGLIAASTLALVLTTRLVGLQVYNPNWKPFHPIRTVAVNIYYYVGTFHEAAGLIGTVILLVGLALWLIPRFAARDSKADGLHIAWAIAVALLLLALPPRSLRYLIYLLPPLVVLSARGWLCAAALFLQPKRLAQTATAAVILLLLLSTRQSLPYLHGLDAAAALAMAQSPSQVFYSGAESGPFVLSVRARDPEAKVTVLRADKLPRQLLHSSELPAVLRRQGIEVVVLEDTANPEMPPAIMKSAASPFRLVASVPLSSSRAVVNGSLHVFRLAPDLAPLMTSPATLGPQRPGGKEVGVKFRPQ